MRHEIFKHNTVIHMYIITLYNIREVKTHLKTSAEYIAVFIKTKLKMLKIPENKLFDAGHFSC